MGPKNIFDDIPASLTAELLQVLSESAQVRIERIVSRGQASPRDFWYDQDRHEWVLVLQGQAGLSVQGEENPIVLGPGDYLDIPAHTRHRVDWTAADRPTLWLAVYYE